MSNITGSGSRENLAAFEHETAEQHKADRHWEALLRKWKTELGEKKRRKQAEESLAGVTDPRAVPAIARIFGKGSSSDQLTAVAMLQRIESQASTRELARLAVFGDSQEVRDAAITSLKKRQPRDYVGALIDLVQFPVQYKVQAVTGPGSRGGLLIDTPRFRLLRTYSAPAAFHLTSSFRGTVVYDADGMPVPYRGVELQQLSSMKPANRSRKSSRSICARER